ncbi:hypothetical protein K1719_023115 [Acacia pycnantha]|nr:hypothetical protein K1719_023115 [Acacia pycnantha]
MQEMKEVAIYVHALQPENKKRNVDPSKYKGTGLMLFPYQPLFESMSIYDLGSPQAFNDLFSRLGSPLNTGIQ